MQVVDAGDLARLVIALLEQGTTGTWNAVGPAEPTTLEGLVGACARAAGSDVEIVPVDPELLDPPLPLVVPADRDALFRRSAARARAAGLTATPLERTAADVLAWDRERGTPELPHGPTPEREAELLAHPT